MTEGRNASISRERVITRRALVAGAGSVLGGLLVGRHRALRGLLQPSTEYGRLQARPVSATTDLTAGDHTLSEDGGRKTVVVVPPTIQTDRAAPLILAFHGATEDETEILDTHRDAAARIGAILIAPSSQGVTWDGIRGIYGPDLERADRALTEVFHHAAIDPHHIAIAGFSDGATYAISLGLVNGDLFTHIIGHSAGFIIPGRTHGRPRVFMAHGTRDSILPIDRCGRLIRTELQHDGYNVEFVEFDGGHAIQPELVQRAMQWFVS